MYPYSHPPATSSKDSAHPHSEYKLTFITTYSTRFIQVKRIQHLLFNLSFGQRRIKRLQYRFDFVDFKEASFVKISRIKYACLRDREWKETLCSSFELKLSGILSYRTILAEMF
jgi:hypothetical protein